MRPRGRGLRIIAPHAPAERCCGARGRWRRHDDNQLRVPELFDCFQGKVALVTGGSIGIGRMIAEGLVRSPHAPIPPRRS